MKYFSLLFSLFVSISLEIDINVMRGESLFNSNLPVIINLKSPEINERKTNVDLVCVIDVSGSMNGPKIEQVKSSLITLISMMGSKDKIGLVLFNSQAYRYMDFTIVTNENKENIINEIKKIQAHGGTSILKGLSIAVDMLKEINLFSTSTSSIILLSDGMDNNLSGMEIIDGLKALTKGTELSFTLNTFGYGNDHDSNLMNKLAISRDGAFYYVENISKVNEYFVNVLGGIMSVVSKNVKVEINTKYKLVKCFGISSLYTHQINSNSFKTEILQFISGKDYTYVCELEIPSDVQYGTEILEAKVEYFNNDKELTSNKNILIYGPYKSTQSPKDALLQANEEYIRSYTYDVIERASETKLKGDDEKAKKDLTEHQEWLKSNYKGKNLFLMEDVNESLNRLKKSEREFDTRDAAYFSAVVSENANKRGGSRMSFSNARQKKMVKAVKK